MHSPIDSQASQEQSLTVEIICDDQCVANAVQSRSAAPTGADILQASGRPATPEQLVLQILRRGGLESIRLEEHADLSLGNKFVISAGDRTYRFTVDDKQYEWPHRLISGLLLHELSGARPDQRVAYQQAGALEVVEPNQLVDLHSAGVEKFVLQTKPEHWKLKVQGMVLDYDIPKVKVEDAMRRAGFDPSKAWHIYLIVQGQPKQEVSADFVVDLRTPGIEKIRLMQRNVDNGDGTQAPPTRAFKLLPADHTYLDSLGLLWETVLEGERRWLLIHDYQLPAGYAPTKVKLALDVLRDYPASQIDMFYFAPFVRLADGREIPSTQVRAIIAGVEYQGWSRHRNASSLWDPNADSVRTHMALVETCLAKELGE